jgi:signal transduction histidine kinase
MSYWLRGKRGGLVSFLAIAALVLGGLGWMTAAVLRLEGEQRAARAGADLVEKLRLALWQLDYSILPYLTREDARPYHHFDRPPQPRLPEETVVTNADPPGWILGYFQVDEKGWKLPQFEQGQPAAAQEMRRRKRVLAELKSQWDAPSLLALLQERGPQELVANTMQIAPNVPNKDGAPGNQGDYDKRWNYQNRAKQQAQSLAPPERVTVQYSRQLVPLWLCRPERPEQLVLARQVRIGKRQMCQGIVLDLPGLQRDLAEQVHDLFPDARFVPMHDKAPPRPERTMAALPIEMEPGQTTAALPPLGWTPLRIGLAIAWSAVVVALFSAGLGGWSLLDLSERRSRFVSAVTHELRTPLTTLRLYLDMLTSGMVQDEARKAEYLDTLHAEADRLNRLIANVLDFSRLENQRPRLDKTRTSLAGLLDQLHSTWQVRCADADKELILDNATGPETALVTDVQLVQQILGNLIDNACKYSRAATDHRIWVRVRLEGRHWIAEVEDQGPGIPPGERRSIFKPFRRGRSAEVTAGGVGLGLALAQRWTALLGGRLTLLCGPDHPGACFRLELPCE